MNRKKLFAGLAAIISIVGIIIYFMLSASVAVYSEDEQKIIVAADKKPLCVFVWSSTCISCIQNLQHINILKQQMQEIGGDLILVVAEDNKFHRKYAYAHCLRQNLIDLKSYYDKNQALQKKYAIVAFPTLLVFKQGKLIKRFEGFVPWASGDTSQEIINLFQ